jgi:hypothetical protein
VVVAHPPPNPVFAEDRYRKKTVKTGLSEKDLIIAVFKWGMKEVKGLSIPQRSGGIDRSEAETLDF